MTGPTPSPGAGLVYFPAEPYEDLRRAALGVATASSSGHGLALLRRHGMAAWMQAWVSCTAAPPSASREPVAPHPTLPAEVVAVWAEMALAAAREVAP